jgi:hypothetical protein
MLIRALAILVMLTLAVTDVTAQDFARNKVDEFTGERTVQTPFVDIEVEEEGSESILLKEACALNMDGQWILIINTASKSWAYIGSDTAYFLVDGERDILEFVHDGETIDGGVVEHAVIPITESFANRIEGASSVRVKIGSYVFDITKAVDDEVSRIKSVL